MGCSLEAKAHVLVSGGSGFKPSHLVRYGGYASTHGYEAPSGSTVAKSAVGKPYNGLNLFVGRPVHTDYQLLTAKGKRGHHDKEETNDKILIHILK